MARPGKPKKVKAGAKRLLARKSSKGPVRKIRDLERRLAEALKREAKALEQLRTRDRELAEALEQQTATSEILGVISRSPTDLQPVFDAIADRSRRLCDAAYSSVYRVDAELVHLVAHNHVRPEAAEVLRRAWPMPLTDPSLVVRAIATHALIHVQDVESDPTVSPSVRERAQALAIRSVLAVPMLRDGKPIGVVRVSRGTPGAFTDREIALLQTFADQAVIAIENVRLFKELEDKNRALTEAHAQVTEALDQQTATAEVLRVISSSPTDVQPVFEVVVRSAVRLLGGASGYLTQLVGDQLRLAALTTTGAEGDEMARARFPLRVTEPGINPEAVRERAPQFVTDMETDSRMSMQGRDVARTRGYRSMLAVPMIRDGAPIGTISVSRSEPGAFTEGQIALLQTFADQAVIAIENVRLFTELEEKNRALTQAHGQVTEALERQTATAEILRVISRSQADARPVFEAIAENAMRLFRAWAVQVYRLDGHWLHLQAARGGRLGMELPDWAVKYEVSRASYRGRSILDRAIVHVRDVLSDPSASDRAREWARGDGWRSAINAPMLLDSAPIGLITVYRLEPGGYLPTEVELLQTFADQAVIAIENARLLGELKARTGELTRSVGELRALGEVGQAISSTLDLQTVLGMIVARATQLSGTDAGVIYEYDESREVFVPRATEQLEAEIVETMLATPVRKGEGATGRLAEGLEPIQVADILVAPAESRVRGALVRAGYRALLAVPLVREGRLLGGLTVIRKATGEFAPEVIELLRTFATQSALAIQNARLFREIADKSHQLEAASRHKSEFLANMSHELRTPLNAIIGYSELLEEEAGDLDGGRLVPDLQKIATAAKHQLSLINDILDLSKIEAGRMELEVAEFDLPSATDNALTLVRERATRRGITLGRAIADGVGVVRGDERKVKQVLLNLLSNAIKFTPEGGRIDVRAAMSEGMAEISIADTGVGIAPEDQEAVFEEFRQVGAADKKVEGTGLGLALARRFVELHGGRIWVTSQVGHGSTFTFTLPVDRKP
jgi:signal transduction histidine kinase/putative methionine-R-sulfoxide reductase with GAF domain